jgi:predicted ATP-dependent serine protease
MAIKKLFGIDRPESAASAFSLICKYALDEYNLDEMDIPPKELILSPWLSECSFTMVSAARGLGKTWWLLDMSVHITRGVPFIGWDVLKPCSVLYVAGEMTARHIQQRLRKLKHGMSTSEHKVIILSSEFFISNKVESPIMSKEIWRDAIHRYLELNPDIRVVVFDTVSALFPGLDENSKEDWGECDQWLNGLRFAGIAPIIVHHLGKSGTPRGTSSREDSLDASIILKHPRGYTNSDGCRFIVEFTKARNNDGEELPPISVHLEGKKSDPFAHFVVDTQEEQSKAYDIFEQHKLGRSYKEISKEFGVGKSYISKVVKEHTQKEEVHS